jgi:hypothetical protein
MAVVEKRPRQAPPQRLERAMTRLTFGGGFHRYPIWSPDGQYAVFGSDTSGIFRTRADGAGQPQPLTQSTDFQYAASFSPEGKRLGYFESNNASVPPRMQLRTVPVEDSGGQLKAGKPERFLKTVHFIAPASVTWFPAKPGAASKLNQYFAQLFSRVGRK